MSDQQNLSGEAPVAGDWVDKEPVVFEEQEEEEDTYKIQCEDEDKPDYVDKKNTDQINADSTAGTDGLDTKGSAAQFTNEAQIKPEDNFME